MLEFAYQHGDDMAPMPYGQGLTSKMMETGAPADQSGYRPTQERTGNRTVGKQWLAPGPDRGRRGGDRRHQRPIQPSKTLFRDDTRLLSTIAAMRAIQTARLHTGRALPRNGNAGGDRNEIAATRDLDPVLERANTPVDHARA
jgi:hypothetical protein